MSSNVYAVVHVGWAWASTLANTEDFRLLVRDPFTKLAQGDVKPSVPGDLGQ